MNSSKSFRPRVVMILQSYLPEVGGAERQLSIQAPHLQRMGVDVQILTRRRTGMPAFEIINSVPVHRLPAWGPKPVAAILFILAALRKIWRLKPQAIHAFELLSPTTVAILAKNLLGIPVIVKVLSGGELGDIYKVLRGRGGQARARWIVHSVDAFIAISKEIDAELAALGVPESKRFFIPNGVDLDRFKPANAPEKAATRAHLGLPEGLMILFVGRLEPVKRLDQLLAIWPRIRARHADAFLVLAGTGSEEKRLREMASEGVHFVGSVEDVVQYLQSADAFVLPSATEGLSNSLLEALACGVPAVATSVGGAVDVIQDGIQGLLVPPDSPTKLSDAIFRLLDDSSLRGSLALAGRERIEESYSLDSAVGNIYALYERMLAQENPR